MNNNVSYTKSRREKFSQIEESEQITLGFLILNPERLTRVKAFLKPENFRYERHQIIFEAMIKMEQLNIPVNVITLFEYLDERGQLDSVGRASYITYLCEIAGES